MTTRVIVVTHSPSPYQVELFDAVTEMPDVDLSVVYLYRADPARSWSARVPRHAHVFAGAPGSGRLGGDAADADLLVVNYYRHPLVAGLMRKRVDHGRAWVFWGERPGFLFPLLGRLARRWLLRGLHSSRAPIWGMGQFALEAYQREFGLGHRYVNLPYFSDLERFTQAARDPDQHAERVILFSGALIPRKGVIELAQAFLAVAPRYPLLRLRLMGSGPLEDRLRSLLTPVSDQVEFLGFRDWAELPGEYAKADILCVPSRYDGWGLVVPEGLAAGLPVIATTRMGAALDLIREGENGWLTSPGDVGSLTQAMQRVGKLDTAALQQLSQRARAAVVDHGLSAGARRFAAACRAAIKDWPCTP
jgi:glycosyltransferase involved in cell wall biosynthesis